MKQAQSKVTEFHKAAGLFIGDKPHLPLNPKSRRLRHDLISEELLELIKAESKNDLVEVADAIGDLLYVVIGTAVTYGIDLEPIFDEIHRSNMTKTKDGTFRADGKYLKGKSYEPPNLHQLIWDQQHDCA